MWELWKWNANQIRAFALPWPRCRLVMFDKYLLTKVRGCSRYSFSESSDTSPLSVCVSALHIPNPTYLTSYESNAHKSPVSVTAGTMIIKIIKKMFNCGLGDQVSRVWLDHQQKLCHQIRGEYKKLAARILSLMWAALLPCIPQSCCRHYIVDSFKKPGPIKSHHFTLSSNSLHS